MVSILAGRYLERLMSLAKRLPVSTGFLGQPWVVEHGMEGVVEAEAALRFWNVEWSGQSFMAIGAKDPDLETMHALRSQIRGCPEPLVGTEAGHFVQEWGEPVARAGLRSFGDL
jgi:haloalkane dehalogenase